MKCTTREMAQERYGVINLKAGTWKNQGLWLTRLDVTPYGFKWTVEGQPVKNIACNKDMVGPLAKALDQIKLANLGPLLKTYDGCFNIRAVRGSSLVSTHAYGLGIDLNADENPLWATKGGFYNHPEFVKCFTDQGFGWGGHFHGRKDPMHFSWAWEG